MYNTNQLISYSGMDFKVSDDGRTTICTMECKLNLREFERQYMQFTRNFIKNRMSKYVPVVYTVSSFDYKSGVDKCRAKYLVMPGGGKAVVLYLDREYYRDADSLPDDRDVIAKSRMLRARARKGEVGEYDYTCKIRVEGKAVCSAEDKFDENVGQAVAGTKAFIKMQKRVVGLFNEINGVADRMLYDLNFSGEMVTKQAQKAAMFMNDILES